MIRILVAEDFPILREDLCETLDSQQDMEVVGYAGSGAEMTSLAQRIPHDLILMDIEMETMNAGILATETIREHNAEECIIFLTAHETEDMILTAMGAGAVDYLVKGCSEEELLRHVRAAYQGDPIMEANIHALLLKEYSRLRKSEQSLLFFIHNLSRLTSAERDLVRHLLQGRKVNEIAKIRVVEPVTVKTQINKLLQKFGCSRSKQVVEMIRELNLEHLF